MVERKYTLKEAVDYIADELLHVCDTEAQEISNYIAENRTPDAVIVLEFVEKIMNAAVSYEEMINKCQV